MADYEIIRYRCQIKGVNNRWETLKSCFNEDEAKMWLRSEIKYGEFPCRVVREEIMQIYEDDLD